MATFFVTGATGQQGSAVVDELLKANQKVHAWTRNVLSQKSQVLSKRDGVTVFEGQFSNVAALTAAMEGCAGVFMNTMPQFTSATGELEDAENIIAAAKAAGVKHLVSSGSTAGDDNPEIDRHLDPASWMSVYFTGKRAVERAVRASGLPRWTLLRPGMFMTNFLQPSAEMMYPELLTEGVFRTAYAEATQMWLIDPSDVGGFAAAAFLDPDRFHEKVMPLAAEVRNLRGIAEEMEKVSGKKIALKELTAEEAVQSQLTESHLLVNKVDLSVDLEEARSWGIPMRGWNEYLEANKELLLKSVGPQ